MNVDKVVLVGTGSENRVVRSIIDEQKGYTRGRKGSKFLKVVGSVHIDKNNKNSTFEAFDVFDDVVFVRAVGSNELWSFFLDLYKETHSQEPPVTGVISDSAYIHPSAIVDDGVVVHHGVHIGIDACVGMGTILNTGCIIEHDCKVGAGAFVGPGAKLLGGACVGNRSFVGAGAIIPPLNSIGADCFVDAGAVLTACLDDRMRFHHARGTVSNILS